ncbi:helicase SNF2 [Variovorax sp. LT1R16]|uniref:helicase SNF2 n=1 Tax=Variovorax sp. LT1R16 TaxID=3443728 RepID=UPI003F455274
MNSLPKLMAAVVVLCAGAAVAETYEGVQPLTTERVRADVVLEAMAAAAAPNPYEEGASSGVAPALRSPTERAIVQREAVDAARAPNQNLDRVLQQHASAAVQRQRDQHAFGRRGHGHRLCGEVVLSARQR